MFNLKWAFTRSLLVSIIASAYALHANALEVSGYTIDLAGKIPINHPGYVNLLDSKNGNPQILVSSFSFFGEDTVKILDQLPLFLKGNSNIKPTLLSDKITWPNEIQWIGSEFLGKSGWLVAGGFLTPGRSNGAITFIDDTTHEVIPITQMKEGFFYHRTQFVHWGPNKKLAILTARVKKPLNPFEKSISELVLLYPISKKEGLRSNQMNQFEEKVLGNGPDVFFQAKDLDGNGIEELVAAEFFSKKLVLYWWENEILKNRILDQGSTAFDLAFGDLKGNGQSILVVTNHEGSNKGSVVAYEVPKDFKKDTWEKHVILDHVPVRHKGFNQASPGSPLVFHPSTSHQGKPWIFLSGDASEKGHLLVPKSNDSNQWSYSEEIVLDSMSTIGKTAIGDVDGDGFPEIFIPAYDLNEIYYYKIRSLSN